MHIYEICLFLVVLGVLGLAAQALLGFGHGHGNAGHHGHDGGMHGHTGHAIGDSHGYGHAAGHGNAHEHGHPEAGNGARLSGLLLGLLSPLTLFSLCVGAGVTGLAVRGEHWAAGIVAAIAACGGVGFTSLVVRPLYGLLFRFASTPSSALEGTLGSEAEVTTPFDSGGRGIVSLKLDGQLVRVLATLDEADRPISAAIRPGEKLIVTSIDARTNACRVARL